MSTARRAAVIPSIATTRATRPCAHCGKPVSRPPSQMGRGLVFCDRDERRAYHRGERA